jgi:sec-independent protein translocase protein TatB
MFGMGFTEIFLILVVAVIALGPEKLPTAVVDIAKFFKKFKNSIDEAKTTINNELKISEMKQQANELKASVADVSNLGRIDLNSINTDRVLDLNDEAKPTKPTKPTNKQKTKINKKISSKNEEA